MQTRVNHYKWLEQHLPEFWVKVYGKTLQDMWSGGIIVAHGDKCSCYQDCWEKAGIPFPHGVAVYFLSYYRQTCPDRDNVINTIGIKQWVINEYPKYQEFLPTI